MTSGGPSKVCSKCMPWSYVPAAQQVLTCHTHADPRGVFHTNLSRPFKQTEQPFRITKLRLLIVLVCDRCIAWLVQKDMKSHAIWFVFFRGVSNDQRYRQILSGRAQKNITRRHTLLLPNGREFLNNSSLAFDVLSCGFNHYAAALGEQFSQVANSIEFLEQRFCPFLIWIVHEKMENRGTHVLRIKADKLFFHDGLNLVCIYIGIIHKDGMAFLQQHAGKALAHVAKTNHRYLARLH